MRYTGRFCRYGDVSAPGGGLLQPAARRRRLPCAIRRRRIRAPTGTFCRDFGGAQPCAPRASTGADGRPRPGDAGGGGGGGGGGVGGGGGGGGGGGDMAMPAKPQRHGDGAARYDAPAERTARRRASSSTKCRPARASRAGARTSSSRSRTRAANAITLSGAKLVYRAGAASSDSNTLVASISKTVRRRAICCSPNTGYTGAAPPAYTYGNGLADGGGGVGLRDSGGNDLVLDGLGHREQRLQQRQRRADRGRPATRSRASPTAPTRSTTASTSSPRRRRRARPTRRRRLHGAGPAAARAIGSGTGGEEEVDDGAEEGADLEVQRGHRPVAPLAARLPTRWPLSAKDLKS